MHRYHWLWIGMGIIWLVVMTACGQVGTPPATGDLEKREPLLTSSVMEMETPSPTPGMPLTSFYQSPETGIGFNYPAEWAFLDGEPGSEHYAGEAGFFRINPIAGGGMTLDELAEAETEHALQPFGASPEIERRQLVGGNGNIQVRMITPSADQPKMEPMEPAWGELVVELPMPVLVNGFLADFLVLQADLDHLEAIAASASFDSDSVAARVFPPDSETPAAGICASYSEPVVNVVVSAETMPEPRCVQVQPGQVLNLLNQAGAELPFTFGPYRFVLIPGEERLLNVPVGKYLAPGVHHLKMETTGSAPEIWLVEPSGQGVNETEQPSQERGVIQGVPIFSADGSLLAIPTSLGVEMVDPTSLALLHLLPVMTGNEFVTFSADGRRLASGAGWHVQLWGNDQPANLDGWTLLREMTGSTSSPESKLVDLGFSPDGKLLAAGFRTAGDVVDGSILIWNSLDGSFNSSLVGMTFDFSPVHDRLAATWQDASGSYIYSYSFSGVPTDIFRGERAFFLPDGLLVAEKDSSVRLIDMNNGKTVHNFVGQPLGISSDGRFLVVHNQGKLLIYNTKDGTIVSTLDGSWEQVSQLLFSPDGNFVAGVGNGCQVDNSGMQDTCEEIAPLNLVWRLSDGGLMRIISGDARADWLAFFPEGQTLLLVRPGGLGKFLLVDEY